MFFVSSSSILGLFIIFFKGTNRFFLVIIRGPEGELIWSWISPLILILYFNDSWVLFALLIPCRLLGSHWYATTAKRTLPKATRSKLAGTRPLWIQWSLRRAYSRTKSSRKGISKISSWPWSTIKSVHHQLILIDSVTSSLNFIHSQIRLGHAFVAQAHVTQADFTYLFAHVSSLVKMLLALFPFLPFKVNIS